MSHVNCSSNLMSLCNLIHINEFMNYYIMGWKKSLQVNLEENFV